MRCLKNEHTPRRQSFFQPTSSAMVKRDRRRFTAGQPQLTRILEEDDAAASGRRRP
jgi:hypothetical protein